MIGTESMERYLVCLLSQVTLYPIAEDYINRWLDAMEDGRSLPDVMELVEAATDEDIPVLTIAALEPYLRQCARSGHVPEPARIVAAIVHGFAEVRFAFGKTCNCPARQPLVADGPNTALDFFSED